MGNKKKSGRKESNKGMSTQNITQPIVNTSPVGLQSNASMSEVLGQSRDVLYSQDTLQSVPPSYGPQTGNIQYMPNMQTIGMQNNTQPGMVQMTNTHMSTGQQVQPSVSTNMGTNMNNGSNNMPAWAASMCKQLQTIHIQLETQNQRWQTVETQLHSQNIRMTNMETQINQLSGLSKSVSETSTNVRKIDQEVKTLKSKVTEYEESVHFYNDICDTLINSNTELKNRLVTLEQSQAANDDKLVDMQWRGMRENLVFSGIPESQLSRDEYEDCESLIRAVIREDMQIMRHIEFDRVHRLGRYKRGQTYPRPIVAKFTYYKDKEYVRHAAPKTLIGTNISVNEQFPSEIEQRRKILYPVAKNARRNPDNKVRLVRDKLFINGQQYIPEDTQNNTKYLSNQGQNSASRYSMHKQGGANNNQAQGDSRQPTNRYTQNVSNQSEQTVFIGRRFAKPKQTPNAERSKDQPLQQTGATGSNDDRFSLSSWVGNAQSRITGFFGQDNHTTAQTKNSNNEHLSTPQTFGKKKASSPLDADQTLKKHKEGDSCTESVISVNEDDNAMNCESGGSHVISQQPGEKSGEK